jgi:RNA polymerase sigma-70 factor (ECF subfamily)
VKQRISHTPADPQVDRSSASELYEAIRTGDEYAFAQYYKISIDRLVVLVTRIINDSEEAINIVQDTFIKLWQQRDQIDPKQSLDGFVSKMAWNAALDFLRHKQAWAKFHDEQLHTQSIQESSSEESFVAEETARRIESIVNNMPPMRRQVFEMSRVDNLTYNQIAEKLHISYNTVLFHMKEALKDVRVVMSLLAFIMLMRGN